MDGNSCEPCQAELQVLWVWGLSFFQEIGRTSRMIGGLHTELILTDAVIYIGTHTYIVYI